MSNAMQVDKVLLNDTAQAVAASQSAQAVSREFQLSSAGASHGIRIEVNVSAITVAAAISYKLQSSPVGGKDAVWSDVDGTNAKSTLSATGWTSLIASPWNTNLATKFPLRAFCRVVVTTGAGDSVTVSDVRLHSPW
jgi:hypothetical protein